MRGQMSARNECFVERKNIEESAETSLTEAGTKVNEGQNEGIL